MNIDTLFTVNGLQKALKAHHNCLNNKHSFPALTGVKPIHRFAEVFDIKNAETFTSQLRQIQANAIETTLNLTFQGDSQSIIIFFENEDSTLRVMVEDKDTFMMITIDELTASFAKVTYPSANRACVIIGNIAFEITYDENGITANCYEPTMGKENINLFTSDIQDIKGLVQIDSQSVDAERHTSTNKQANFIVVEKKLEQVITYGLRHTYEEALNVARESLIEQVDNYNDDREVFFEFLPNDPNNFSDCDDAIYESLVKAIKQLSEQELDDLMKKFHEATSFISINQL